MLRKTIIRLWNQRRNNLSIFIELCLVFCLVWYIVDFFMLTIYNRHTPNHRDLSHTWKLEVGVLPDNHPDFQVSESDSLAMERNYWRIIDRIKQRPETEALAVLSGFSSPGGGGYYGRPVRALADSSETGGMWILTDPRGDFLKVFHYTDENGKPLSLSDFPTTDNGILLGRLLYDAVFPQGDGIGKTVYFGENETRVVLGTVGDAKRFAYGRPIPMVYSFQRVGFHEWQEFEIAFRVHADVSTREFQTRIAPALRNDLRIGNFYVISLRSYEEQEAKTTDVFGVTAQNNSQLALMLFFLLNIMLCITGTFWYRIRQRRGEIGLLRAIGARQSDIRRMFYLEGLALLTAAGAVALFVEMQFVFADMLQFRADRYLPNALSWIDRMPIRFLLANLITWLILAVCIVFAIWIPVSMASKANIADALHEEG